MSQSPQPPVPMDDLQFNTVEPASAAAPTVMACARCRQPLTDEYYALASHVLCGSCAGQLGRPPGGNEGLYFLRALLYGLGVAIVGAIAWYAIIEITGYVLSIVAIGVGYCVGTAMRKGSGGRGGLEYQLIAVALTYFAMIASYAAWYLQLSGDHVTAESIFHAATYAVEQPFARGSRGILGLIIIGFGLMRAWQTTADIKLPISGPFKVSLRPPTTTSGGSA